MLSSRQLVFVSSLARRARVSTTTLRCAASSSSTVIMTTSNRPTTAAAAGLDGNNKLHNNNTASSSSISSSSLVSAAAAAVALTLGMATASSYPNDENNATATTTRILSAIMDRKKVQLEAATTTTHATASPTATSAAVVLDQGEYENNEDPSSSSSPNTATTLLLNWSGTHAVTVENNKYYEPETVEEIEQIVADCYRRGDGSTVRPLGSALSPNGIGFAKDGMMSLSNLDQVLEIDTLNQTVTVQAGARVSQVVEALRPYNLTLPNLASIAEQQMGGFISVGAHGTGRCVAPVDDYVTKIKLVTPSERGTVELTRESHGDIFDLAKVGLGCLGIVVEITMQCIPAHKLVEHTFVLTRDEAVEQLDTLLTQYKHMRYMWIPYTDAVVVVTNHPQHEIEDMNALPNFHDKPLSEAKRFAPLRDLLQELSTQEHEKKKALLASDDDEDDENNKIIDPPFTPESMQGMGFGELRDALLAIDPLNIEHVKRVNAAEAEFWRRSSGYQIKPSDQLLQFDCGGQQWVWEVCFPTGTVDKSNGNDMEFMKRLLEGIEEQKIPAHSPIEQRWSSASSSFMSPAHGPPEGLFSWVGIINYLPLDNDQQRREITELFQGPYCDLMRTVCLPFSAVSHWAKLEQPKSIWKLVDLQLLLQSKYPVDAFNRLRSIYDPKNIMANQLLNNALGDPRRKQ